MDLISSAKQISSAIADFILGSARISLYNALEVTTVAENKLADLSTDFAVKILKLTDGMKGHHSLINQLERSATNNANRKRYRFGKPRNHNGFWVFSCHFSRWNSKDIISQKRPLGRT